ILPHPIVVDEKCLMVPKASCSNKLTLCYVGRIHPAKGVSNCIELVNSLLPYFSDISHKIMGNDDGDLVNVKRKIVEFNLQERVHFIDASYDDKRFYLYRE